MAHKAIILELPVNLSSLAVTATLPLKLIAKPSALRHYDVPVSSHRLYRSYLVNHTATLCNEIAPSPQS
jgi:hypothetical protein